MRKMLFACGLILLAVSSVQAQVTTEDVDLVNGKFNNCTLSHQILHLKARNEDPELKAAYDGFQKCKLDLSQMVKKAHQSIGSKANKAQKTAADNWLVEWNTVIAGFKPEATSLPSASEAIRAGEKLKLTLD